MAAGFDGSVRIDTSLDAQGFNQGISGILAGLGKIGAALGIAFSIAAIVKFVKAGLDAASQVQMINMRFQTFFGALAGQTQKQLEDFGAAAHYCEDDLKNMASTLMNVFRAMGVAGQKAADLSVGMTELATDTATFFSEDPTSLVNTFNYAMMGFYRGLRQYGVTMSEVEVKQRALTMGLYSGKGALDETARALATAALLQEKFAYTSGYAAKSANTWQGQIRGIQVAWDDFVKTMGKGFMEAVIGLLPVITWLLGLLNALATGFANLMGLLFGVQIQVSSVGTGASTAAGGVGDLSDGMGDLADNTNAAGEAAKGALAPFDELNVLAQKQPTGKLPNLGVGGITAIKPINFEQTDGLIKKWWKDLLKWFEDSGLADWFRQTWENIKNWAINAWASIVAFMTPLIETLRGKLGHLWDALVQFWNSVLLPIFTAIFPPIINFIWKTLKNVWNFLVELFRNLATLIMRVVGGVVDIFRGIIDFLTGLFTGNWQKAWEGLKEIALGVWDILMAVFEFAGRTFVGVVELICKVLLDFFEMVGRVAVTLGQYIWTALMTFFELVGRGAVALALIIWGAMTDAWNWIVSIWQSAVDWFKVHVVGPIVEWFVWLVDQIKIGILDAWNWVVRVWEGAPAWFQNVIDSIKNWFNTAWTNIKTWALTAWENIKKTWSIVAAWFRTNVIDPVKDWFNQAWLDITDWVNTAWDNIELAWNNAASWFQENVIDPIKNAFSGVWDGIANAAGNAFSSITNYIIGMVNTAISYINNLISAINSIPGIPDMPTIPTVPVPGSGGGGGGGCFIAGTPVLMANGYSKPIEEVQVGDRIRSWDGEKDCIISVKVEKVFHHAADEMNGYFVVNNRLGVTPVHRLFINDTWAAASTLQIGDRLKDADRQDVLVTSIGWIDQHCPVYNLQTDHRSHNYFAGGALVHNVKTFARGGVFPPRSPFYAVLGDQTSGRNIKTPEALIRQIVREETQGLVGGQVTIRFEGNLAALVRQLKPYIDKENSRVGASLISSGITG